MVGDILVTPLSHLDMCIFLFSTESKTPATPQAKLPPRDVRRGGLRVEVHWPKRGASRSEI